MIASVEFLGTQRAATETNSVDIPLSEKTSVRDALDYVNQRYPALGLDIDNIVITLNGEVSSPERILNADDVIVFLPVIGGG